jgi:hypothetical protein
MMMIRSLDGWTVTDKKHYPRNYERGAKGVTLFFPLWNKESTYTLVHINPPVPSRGYLGMNGTVFVNHYALGHIHVSGA